MNARQAITSQEGYLEQNQLLRILTATAASPRDSFFRDLTKSIAGVCEVTVAFVSELLLDSERARIVAATLDDRQVDPVEFDLDTTPCREVVADGVSVHREGIARRYPHYHWLTDISAQAFIGVLLTSTSGDPLGVLGIVNSTAIQNPEPLLGLLQDLRPRVATAMEQRQRGNALRRSEARFRLLAENSKDILFYEQLLPEVRVEYISPAVQEITGYPPEAFEANPETALRIIHDDDRHRVRESISSGSEDPILARLIRPDGQVRWVEYHNFPFRDEDSRLIAMGGTIRDVTPRVQAEQALRMSEQYRRALLEAIPDTMFRLDSNGVLLDFVSGDAIRDELQTPNAIGKNVKEVLPGSLVARVRHLSQQALRTGERQRLEFEVSSANESRFFEARCMPFGEDEVLFMLRDFTAIKWHEAEEERQKLRDELDVKVEQRIRTNPYGLTYRELAVLHLVAQGFADKQIAEALGISIYTVNKHVGNIRGKMNAASRTEAGVRAIREGLLG